MSGPPGGDRGEVTRALEAAAQGDDSAWERVLPEVYAELRAIAGHLMRTERREHTFQPTALVHEAYLRLVGTRDVEWSDRRHFIALAARAMRRLLVDHARRRHADKRGGEWCRVSAVDVAANEPAGPGDFEVLALHQALEQLAELSPRQAALVELRYFGGMTLEEAGEHLGVSRSTAKLDWSVAKAWLHQRLRG